MKRFNKVKLGILFISSIMLFTSCKSLFEKNDYEILLVLEDAKGFKNGANVMYKGLEVGKLKNVDRKGVEVIGTLVFPNDFKIPINSVFIANQKTLFGKKTIEIEFSTETENYKSGDKVFVSKSTNPLENMLKNIDIDIDSTIIEALDSLGGELEKIKDENGEVIMDLPKGTGGQE